MSVLVAGGAGYIGSVTVAALRAAGEAVVVLDDLSAGHREAVPSDVVLYAGDIADEGLVREIVGRHRVDGLVHFAALTSVPGSVARPDRYLETNVGKMRVLLDTLRSCGVRRVVFSSSAAVYGDGGASGADRALREEDPAAPTHPYGLTKWVGERMLHAYEAAFGVKWVALRYFNAAGATDDLGEDHSPETHLIPILLEVAAGRRERVAIFGRDYPTPDGTCVRDFVHVADLADAHVLALRHLAAGGESATLNLGSGRGHSVLEVVQAVRAVTGAPVRCLEQPRRPGDPAHLVAAAAGARRLLGWETTRSALAQIVESAWRWRRLRHPDGYRPG